MRSGRSSGAGYGAALLPEESHGQTRDERIAVRPLSPALWRQLGLAVSDQGASGPTRFVLEALLPEKASAT